MHLTTFADKEKGALGWRSRKDWIRRYRFIFQQPEI